MKKRKQLPVFKNEDEEREFWATHELSDVFDVAKGVNVVFPNLKRSTKAITIRVPESLLYALKVLANKKDVPYQSLMKIFLDEKVREENRLASRQGVKTSALLVTKSFIVKTAGESQGEKLKNSWGGNGEQKQTHKYTMQTAQKESICPIVYNTMGKMSTGKQ